MEKVKRGPGSNRRQADYGSAALPLSYPARSSCGRPLRVFNCFDLTQSCGGANYGVCLLLGKHITPLRDTTARQIHRTGEIRRRFTE